MIEQALIVVSGLIDTSPLSCMISAAGQLSVPAGTWAFHNDQDTGPKVDVNAIMLICNYSTQTVHSLGIINAPFRSKFARKIYPVYANINMEQT